MLLAGANAAASPAWETGQRPCCDAAVKRYARRGGRRYIERFNCSRMAGFSSVDVSCVIAS
ncbi:hypothetical protein, partial [Burkholderia cenocepacia]|uniref:hypothetical protein n=1 Tax=Burkholderia cenocepacia TaxID=95486 RepID=UPI001F4B966A